MNNIHYKNISTKVNAEAYETLFNICDRSGITVYQFLQMVVDTIIRYRDEDKRLSPELEQIIGVFEHMSGWEDAFNLADTDLQPEILEATYFLGETGKKGCRAVHVHRTYFGDCHQTYNIADILERTFCHLLPELYRKLRSIGVDIGSYNIIQTIMMLIEDRVREEDLRELRRPFDDNERSQSGRKLAKHPFKRKHRKDIEKLPTIYFTEEDDNTDEQE